LQTENENLDALKQLPRRGEPASQADQEREQGGKVDDDCNLKEHIVDGLNLCITFLELVNALGVVHLVAGSDFLKDWIKGQGEELKANGQAIARTQDLLNNVINILEEAAVKRQLDDQRNVNRFSAAVADETAEYNKRLAAYAKTVDEFTKGKHPKIPPQYEEMLKVVKTAQTNWA